MSFEWENEKGASSVFELSRDKTFTQIIIKKDLLAHSTKVTIPEIGDYYWRSRKLHADGTLEVSEPRRVIIEKAPAPAKPDKLPDMEIPLHWKEKPKSSSFFNWLLDSAYADDWIGVAKIELPQDENAKKYLLKIFAQDGELVLEKELTEPSFEWTNARPGRYRWQYAVIDFWDRASPFSDLSELIVREEEIQPEKVKLISPIRKIELHSSEIVFRWTASPRNRSYLFELSNSENFETILHSQKVSSPELQVKNFSFHQGLYFWRITSEGRVQKVMSNTGRFVFKVPAVAIPIPLITPEEISWKNRLSLAWAPSLDSYTFSQSSKDGEISGQVLLGLEGKGTLFKAKWILNAELLRQSGKVFKKETYLFQRLEVDGGFKFGKSRTLFVLGGGLAHTSAQSYGIQNNEVVADNVSSFNYGPVLRSYHRLSKNWELQTKTFYFLGSVKQLEIMGEGLHFQGNKFYSLGIGFAQRDYELNEGAQRSLRLTLGVGKEF